MPNNVSASSRSCAECSSLIRKTGKTHCSAGPGDRPVQPQHCPADQHAELIQQSLEHFRQDPGDARLTLAAAKVEKLCYQAVDGGDLVAARWTRVQDLIALAHLMGYRKVGIATCIGLLDECQRLSKILQGQGLQPFSVCCKAGSIDKTEMELQEADKIRPGNFEAACNPIAQARICNAAETDLNIILGLCVGHDMLFNRHAEAPVTTLVVKDRVTGHNPVSVLYGQNAYYRHLQRAPVISDPEVVAHREEIERQMPALDSLRPR